MAPCALRFWAANSLCLPLSSQRASPCSDCLATSSISECLVFAAVADDKAERIGQQHRRWAPPRGSHTRRWLSSVRGAALAGRRWNGRPSQIRCGRDTGVWRVSSSTTALISMSTFGWPGSSRNESSVLALWTSRQRGALQSRLKRSSATRRSHAAE